MIINSQGFAADLDVKLDVGIDDIGLSLSVSSRLLINTTRVDQEVENSDRLIDFINDSQSSLKDDLLDRLVDCENSSGLCYTIDARAPISPTRQRAPERSRTC